MSNENENENVEDNMTEMDRDIQTNRETRDEVIDKVRDFDFESAATLMGILEKQVAVVPKMTALAGVAALGLQALDDEARAILNERAEATKRKEAEQAQAERDRLMQLRKEEDDQAKANLAAREDALRDADARGKLDAEKAERAKVPLTSEPNSPRAAPNRTQAETARRV